MVLTTYHPVPLLTVNQPNILGYVGDLAVATDEQLIRMIESYKKEKIVILAIPKFFLEF